MLNNKNIFTSSSSFIWSRAACAFGFLSEMNGCCFTLFNEPADGVLMFDQHCAECLTGLLAAPERLWLLVAGEGPRLSAGCRGPGCLGLCVMREEMEGWTSTH